MNINKINPLYIFALFITLLVVSMILKNNKESEFLQRQSEFLNLKADIQKYNSFKLSWRVNKNDLKRFVQANNFKNTKIIQNNKNILISYSSKENIKLNEFLNKFLNSKFPIEKIEIKKEEITFKVRIF